MKKVGDLPLRESSFLDKGLEEGLREREKEEALTEIVAESMREGEKPKEMDDGLKLRTLLASGVK